MTFATPTLEILFGRTDESRVARYPRCCLMLGFGRLQKNGYPSIELDCEQ